MNELHPTAIALRKVDAEYRKALARIAAIKKDRAEIRAEHRAAIIESIVYAPDTTNVDLAAMFGVTEGTIRNVRNAMSGA